MRSGSHVIDRAPPRALGDGGGGGGWAWLLTASGIVEAQLVRGLLEAAGIVPVALDGSDPSPGAWMFLAGNVNAPVRVFVPASMLDAARLALLETGFGMPEEPAASVPAGEDAGRSPWLRRIWLVVAALVAFAMAWVIFVNGCVHASFC